MKTKLLFLKAAGIALLLSSQVSLAQTGGSFLPTVPSATTEIQFENFDLGANQDATIGSPTGPYGYSDLTAGNLAGNGTTYLNNNYRPGTDVDIAAPASGVSAGEISINSGLGEHLYYTVNFAQTGKYSILVNYGHSNANPRAVKFELFDTAFANPAVVLADGTLVRTASSTSFADNPVTDATTGIVNGNTIIFDITTAGTYVIKFTTVQSGPNYNRFQFIREGDLSTNTFDKGANALEVYPNPSNNGQFNLSIESKWEVYSVLGAKIAEGEGTKVDLSNAAKGAYILKTGNTSKKLIVN